LASVVQRRASTKIKPAAKPAAAEVTRGFGRLGVSGGGGGGVEVEKRDDRAEDGRFGISAKHLAVRC
jgi:hypothetical protein